MATTTIRCPSWFKACFSSHEQPAFQQRPFGYSGWLGGEPAAVDVEHLAGDVARGVRGEEDRCADQIARLAPVPHRDPAAHPGVEARVRLQRRGEIGLDVARGEDVHPHPVRRPFGRQHFGEPQDAVLAGSIGGNAPNPDRAVREPMVMMLPLRWASITRPAAWQAKKTALRLVSMTASQSASVRSTAGPRRLIPATLTSTSSRPKASTVLVTIACTWAISATSVGSASARVPSCSASAAQDSNASTVRLASASVAPARPSPSAIARPIPRDAPVTSATLPSSRNSSTATLLPRGFAPRAWPGRPPGPRLPAAAARPHGGH